MHKTWTTKNFQIRIVNQFTYLCFLRSFPFQCNVRWPFIDVICHIYCLSLWYLRQPSIQPHIPCLLEQNLVHALSNTILLSYIWCCEMLANIFLLTKLNKFLGLTHLYYQTSNTLTSSQFEFPLPPSTFWMQRKLHPYASWSILKLFWKNNLWR